MEIYFKNIHNSWIIIILFILSISSNSCNKNDSSANFKSNKYLFELHTSKTSGITFENKLVSTTQMNLFKYMYYYNGGGLGVADFNNDGLADIFFTGNMVDNKLYINKGNLKFEDVTEKSGILKDSTWSNGVSVVDINNDGLMDIYISQVGNFDIFQGHNQLWLCKDILNGVPRYEEKSKEFGIDFKGYGTQATFFDYDLDGDLDLFLLNHSTHNNGTFGERKSFIGTYHHESGDKMFKNENGKYVDVTKSCGINSSVIGYGLGVISSDINFDGYPDLYIGNDFHENDYLYINQKDGTFKEVLTEQIMHTSRFSMGVDAADLNNDGFNEIISLDMLPEDPAILKRSENDEDVSLFNFKIQYGYNHQYSRNCLQLNNGNGSFSEIGIYSGVHATDWSWSPLFFDMNHDGKKDLFISNGIPKRMNDLDYINFVQDQNWQWKTRNNEMTQEEIDLITKIPEVKLNNKFFILKDNIQFEDNSQAIENLLPSYSNGAAYADFDNDGDLDVIVNNINESPFLYENNEINKSNKYNKFHASIKLVGDKQNINAIGAKIISYSKELISYYEYIPVRGFQSSSAEDIHLTTSAPKIDSIKIIWPDRTYQTTTNIKIGKNEIKKLAKLKFKYELKKIDLVESNLINITEAAKFSFIHKENDFVEFHREPLIPFTSGEDGPAVAIGDINNDGLDDIYLGASKNKKAKFFIQSKSGKFKESFQPSIENDSVYEDIDAVITDINNDGLNDLIVASGGNEYSLESQYTLPRLYINIGNGKFEKSSNAFNVNINASCISIHDVNNDGFIDLFIGARSVPYNYGIMPKSFLLINNKKGQFLDKTPEALMNAGLVKDAEWIDINNDTKKELVIASEWGNIISYEILNNKVIKRLLTDKNGWWNKLFFDDFDGDGDIDIIAGNLGSNVRLKPKKGQPIKMYLNDFDNNNTKEQIVSYFVKDREVPFANKIELEKKVPYIKKKFLKASDFSRASMEELFTKEKLVKSDLLIIDYVENAILLNDGKGNFSLNDLPYNLQFSSINAITKITDEKYLVGMNLYKGNIQIGRLDAGQSGYLSFNNNNIRYELFKDLIISGEVKHIVPINVKGEKCYIFIRNNEVALLFKSKK